MILKVADEIHADVIAMSTHGRSGIQRWLMGSVADRVVHHSHIPVMLIHPN
jgi:nucleotide-binding universal stress UspA family protein